MIRTALAFGPAAAVKYVVNGNNFSTQCTTNINIDNYKNHTLEHSVTELEAYLRSEQAGNACFM